MTTYQSRRTPSPPPPVPTQPRTLSRQGSSNGSFICNVSDDEVVERDVDLEIEARFRSNTLSDSESELPVPAPRVQRTGPTRSTPRRTSGTDAPTRQPSTKSTLSQRMLSALQRRKNQTASRPKRSGSILLEVVQSEQGSISEGLPRGDSTHSMGADFDGLVVPDPFYDPSLDPVYMSDDESTPISLSSISMSCKDRLEARISDRLSQNKSSLSAHPEGHDTSAYSDANDLSVVYTNRRTYPAESSKKVDVRHSDNHMDTRYGRAGVTPEQRANRAAGNYYQQQFGSQQYSKMHSENQSPSPPPQQQQQQPRHESPSRSPSPYQHAPSYVNIRGPIEPTMEILDSNKSLPVAFHFQGQNGRAPVQPAPIEHHQHHHSHHRVQPHNPAQREFDPAASQFQSQSASREPPRGDDAYMTLSQSVDQIEQVVDGLENLFLSSSFVSLATIALRELELLRESAQQIRTSGTTRILAEVGRPHSQMLGPFRQLVARSASLQNRIDLLIYRIRSRY